MGRLHVTLELANYDDLALVRGGLLDPGQVRRSSIVAVVNSATAKLVLPQAAVKQLGLPLSEPVTVRNANGRTPRRRQAEGVSVELLGRRGSYTAVVEPRRRSAAIGFIVLQDLDLVIDHEQQQIVPRDPRCKIYEIE